jgi:AmmeMemoRadiSam system protein B
MTTLRQASVAGIFYPADPSVLKREIAACFARRAQTPEPEVGAPRPRIKALIVPHAGYVYSGPIAATAYARLGEQARDIRRVVLLGPSHRMPLRGLALCDDTAFATPLGSVAVDSSAYSQLLALPQVRHFDAAFYGEHCLEVQLPFLQELLTDFSLIPLLVGDAGAREVAEVLEVLWGGDETLILVSSDLSHYLDDARARVLDARTTAAILALDARAIGPDQACGRQPIAGLLELARAHRLQAEQLDLRNSSQTAGSPDRVVGYGAYAFH